MDSEDDKKAAECMAHAKQVALACVLYAADHNDALPPNLEILVPLYLKDRSLLVSPLATDTKPISYEYLLPGETSKLGEDHRAILRCRFTGKDGKRTIIYADTSGERL